MAKLHTGDIVEVRTGKGLAYAQYALRHKQYGALLRVFNQTYAERPINLKMIVESEPSFLCFFPLSAAVDQHIVVVVGNEPLTEQANSFPTFRAGVIDPATRKVGVWWLWDGEKEWRVGELSDEQRKLPIRGVWNDTLLIERIEANWTPATDPS